MRSDLFLVTISLMRRAILIWQEVIPRDRNALHKQNVKNATQTELVKVKQTQRYSQFKNMVL